ncbi:toxin-antitoxin system, toxin component [Actinokineospora bangkokensis]|uniref:Toxin-antitoxin system, toxin component n=2 Tax=Actinokineospora bangkokensis TaxID=1193682 RepID=A0A1Q9LGY3_9PSEU|nr:toxin-antitoxin system, toxin component [Actinokineospora bangkokensis]
MTREEEGRAAATRFRHEHNLGVLPLGDLIALVELTTGVDVAVLDTDPDEHGLTMRDPASGAVFIGVARTTHPMRQRSTLAHELAHVLFEDWTEWSDRSRDRSLEEVRADAFARHLLIPVEGVVTIVAGRTATDEAVLSEVVQRFLVSPQLAAIALHQAGQIDFATKQRWMAVTTPQLAIRFGWIDQYRSLQELSNKRRAPQRLLARAIRGYAEGILPAQAIATLLEVPVAQVETDLHDAGIVPVIPPATWTGAAELETPQVDMAALDVDLGGPCEPESTAPQKDSG